MNINKFAVLQSLMLESVKSVQLAWFQKDQGEIHFQSPEVVGIAWVDPSLCHFFLLLPLTGSHFRKLFLIVIGICKLHLQSFLYIRLFVQFIFSPLISTFAPHTAILLIKQLILKKMKKVPYFLQCNTFKSYICPYFFFG